MISCEIDLGFQYERGQLRYKIKRFKYYMGRAIAVGCFEFVADVACRGENQYPPELTSINKSNLMLESDDETTRYPRTAGSFYAAGTTSYKRHSTGRARFACS
jgi:hypothetical protein